MNDPLSDPLSGFSEYARHDTAVAATTASIRQTTWKHDLFAEPFAHFDQPSPSSDDSVERLSAESMGRGDRGASDEGTASSTSTPITISSNTLLGHSPHSSLDAFSSTSLTPRAGAPSPFTARFSLTEEEEAGDPFPTLEALHSRIIEACSSGDVDLVKALVRRGVKDEERISTIDLVNFTRTSTRLTPLHYAVAKGHAKMVTWLINEKADLETQDSQGETALLKSTDLVTLTLLMEAGANVEAADRDGWRAIHNAASNGQLDIVRYLVETAKASIDARSSTGYTALMSAAAKGHLPLARYLIKNMADPFLRNDFGETAFDIASSVFEIHIATILAQYEAAQWIAQDSTRDDYNPLVLHSTLPVIINEHQRLGLPTIKKLSSLSPLAAAPRWSSKALSKNDDRTAFTTAALLGMQEETVVRPVLKNEVQLPVIGDEFNLRLPARREIKSGGVFGSEVSESQPLSSVAAGKRPAKLIRTSSSTSSSSASALPSTSTALSDSASSIVESAYYWLSDWTVELTDPASSPEDGWSYAHSFDAPPSEWMSEPSEELQNLMDGVGGFVSGVGAQKWVRKRKWVRLMRRRLDVPHWGFGHILNGMIEGDEEGEAGDELKGSVLAEGSDYVARSQFLIGAWTRTAEETMDESFSSTTSSHTIVHIPDHELDRMEARRTIVRLERAIEELRDGISDDDDEERKTRAIDMMEVTMKRLTAMREDIGGDLSDESDDEDDISFDDAPSTSNSPTRRPSITSNRSRSTSRSFLNQRSHPPSLLARSVSSSSAHSQSPFSLDLAVLPSAPEHDFRVPTKEVPLNSTPSGSGTSSAQWESDDVATSCRPCRRVFNFFNRKHHCRRCGRIFCGSCSKNEDRLEKDDFVTSAEYHSYVDVYGEGSGSSANTGGGERWSSTAFYRTCDECHSTLERYNHLTASSILSPSTLFPAAATSAYTDPTTMASPSISGDSEASELSDCPVCGVVLSELGERSAQEAHVQDCLDHSQGAIRTNGRYLVFKLPAASLLVGTECSICFAEFEEGNEIARLPCLDYFHRHCIAAWISRKGGNSCPFHTR